MVLRLTILVSSLIFISCGNENKQIVFPTPIDTNKITSSIPFDSTPVNTGNPGEKDSIPTGNLFADELVGFAKTQLGVPYKYASADPSQGFDCSGFITYVFKHFSIDVPRSSIDFTHVGKEIAWQQALPGDLILFTGTDSLIKEVGHMGIITDNKDGKLQFIHSTSGKQKGVVITPFEEYYKSRFIKVIRVLATSL